MNRPKIAAGNVNHYGRVLLVFILMVAPTGCAGIAGKGRMEKFSEIIDSYENALERSDYRKASKFVDPSAEGILLDHNQFANVKIVRHKVTHIEVSDDKRSIEQDVEIQYFLLDRNLLRTIVDHQVWKYEEEGKVWLLQTGLPELVH
jgi:hypothetical protein